MKSQIEKAKGQSNDTGNLERLLLQVSLHKPEIPADDIGVDPIMKIGIPGLSRIVMVKPVILPEAGIGQTGIEGDGQLSYGLIELRVAGSYRAMNGIMGNDEQPRMEECSSQNTQQNPRK